MKYILIVALSILMMACKKKQDPTKPIVYGKDEYGIGILHVEVTSNFKYPTLIINKDGVATKKYNYSGFSTADTSALIHEQPGPLGEYNIYSRCSKNSADTTINITDNNLIWNRLKIKIGSQVVYDSTTTANSFDKRTATSNYIFKIK